VLYYHPEMLSLAEKITELCNRQRNTPNAGDASRWCSGVELKDSIQWKKFPDGFPKLFINNVKEDCAGRDVLFLGSLHSPNIIFEQISILYAIPRYLSRSVTFILPYFPTATMERVDTEGSVATAWTLARILSATPLSARGPCQVVIFDIHSLQERFYFEGHVIPRLESAIPLLQREIMRASLPDVTIAFPDDGAYKRFYTMFEQYPSITCLKIREGDKRIVKIKEGEASGRHCIIVDDLVMTGGTLIECAKVLKENGAATISAYVTHAVFPELSWKKFCSSDSLFEKFYITDSIPHARDIAKNKPFHLLSLSERIAEVLLGFDLVQT